MSVFKKFDHIDIVVKDIDKAVEYWQKLGPEVRRTSHLGGSVEFSVGDITIELHEAPDRKLGTDHISFLVEGGLNELKTKRQELIDKGCECKKISYVAATSKYLFSFTDLEGYRLQACTKILPDALEEAEKLGIAFHDPSKERHERGLKFINEKI